MNASQDDSDALFDELLALYHESLARGEGDEDFFADMNDISDDLRERLRLAGKCVHQLHAAWHGESPETITQFDDITPDPLLRQLRHDVPQRIGSFEIVRELGRGGGGVVLLARDPILARLVALKLPLPKVLENTELRERFHREAEIAARLRHPNLVAIFESGDAGPFGYIVSEYCAGPNLAQWLRKNWLDHPPAMLEIASFITQLARGVHHAHTRDVVHRDLKPSNILLDPVHAPAAVPAAARAIIRGGGTGDAPANDLPLSAYIPKVADFGLAKLVEENSEQTRTGVLLGTLLYMSPEQAAGRVREITVQSDVYALGAILYELLAGRPPLSGECDRETQHQILMQEPLRPRRGAQVIPRDLEAICLKCLEKEPRARYATADALAEDLLRYAAGLPVGARRPTFAERTLKWMRRRPIVAGLSCLLLTAVCTIIVGTLFYHARHIRTVAELHEQRVKARNQERDAREYVYGVDMHRAARYWEQGDAAEARKILNAYVPHGEEEDLRGVEWRLLSRCLEWPSVVVAEQPTPVWSMAASPDGKTFATGDAQGVIRLWRRGESEAPRELNGHAPGHIDRLIFTVDGARLLSAGNDHTIRWWNVATGEAELVGSEHTDWVGGLDCSADGKWIASGDGAGRVLLWNAETRALDRELYRHAGAVRWVAFHPQHSWIFSACEAGEVRVWDYAINGPPETFPEGRLPGHAEPIWRGAVFRPDGLALFAGERDRIFDWNLKPQTPSDGRLVTHLAASRKVMALAALDGRLIEGTRDGSIVVRRFIENIRPWHFLNAHSKSIRSLAPLRDRKALLTGSDDGTVREWDFAEIHPWGRMVNIAGDWPIQMSWSPGDNRLWTLHENHCVNVIDDPAAPRPQTLNDVGHRAMSLVALADNTFLTIDAQGIVRRNNDRGVQSPESHFPGGVKVIAANMAQTRFACATNTAISLQDAMGGQMYWRTETPSHARQIVFLPDGGIAAGCTDGVVRRFSAINGTLQATSSRQGSAIEWLSLSEDGEKLVTSSHDRTVRVLDVDSLSELTTLTHSEFAKQVWFMDQDRRLLLIDERGLTVINPLTGQTLLSISERIKGPAELSHDRKWLATCSPTTVRLLRLE